MYSYIMITINHKINLTNIVKKTFFFKFKKERIPPNYLYYLIIYKYYTYILMKKSL